MNRITIQPTIFENHPQGSKTYGYRMYDNYGVTYCNVWESIPDDDLDIIKQVMEDGDDTAQAMLGFCLEYGRELFVGDVEYEWKEIKHLFGD